MSGAEARSHPYLVEWHCFLSAWLLIMEPRERGFLFFDDWNLDTARNLDLPRGLDLQRNPDLPKNTDDSSVTALQLILKTSLCHSPSRHRHIELHQYGTTHRGDAVRNRARRQPCSLRPIRACCTHQYHAGRRSFPMRFEN